MSPHDDGDRTGDESQDRQRLDRRTFIVGAGGATGAVVFETNALAKQITTPGTSQVISVGQQIAGLKFLSKPSFSVLVRRREDFLFLRIEGYNLVRKGHKLVRAIAGHDAYLVVEHFPQALAEQAFVDPLSSKFPKPQPPGKAHARLAYPSRLAFKLPKKTSSIPFTVAGLLDWAALEPSLTPVADQVAKPPPLSIVNPVVSVPLPVIIAEITHSEVDSSTAPPSSTPVSSIPPTSIVPKKPPKIREPTATETAIELPWRLALSPIASGRWSHPVVERTLAGWTELWHTRLASSPDPTALDGAPIRAVWNYDTVKGKPTLDNAKKVPAADKNSPFLYSMNHSDRYQIVRASSDFTLSGRADIAARRLWLSTRGAFLDSRGIWEGLPDIENKKEKLVFDLVEWRHVATLARDQYVKVVTKGYLFPFGHPAVKLTVTERRFDKVGSEIVATSRQKTYLVVRQPDMSYGSSLFGAPNDSRDFPFRAIHMVTLRTPDLDPSSPAFAHSGANKTSGETIVPTVNSLPFLWHCIGTDWVGRQIAFTTPLIFVDIADSAGPVAAHVVSDYNAIAPPSTLNLGNFQGTAFAFGESHTQGDTDLETHSITFGANNGAGAAQNYRNRDQGQYFPMLRSAVVRLSAAEQASGGQALNNTPVVSYHAPFVNGGGFNTASNVGNVFMALDPTSLPAVQFGGGSSGGVITPNLLVSGLSRSLGPVAGDLGAITGGTFDPASIFKDVEAKILGGVNLIDLIAKAFPSGDHPGSDSLKITYDTSGSTLTTHLTWTPNVRDDNPVIQKNGPDTSFVIDGLVTTDLEHPENSTFTINGQLTDFTVWLMSTDDSDAFISIQFDSLTFQAAKNQKSTVQVNIPDSGVGFHGVLEFIEQLEEFLDFSGEGGPKIEVLPTGISADLSVPIPDIAVGVFALTNIAFEAGFNLPFDGSPARFRFAFSTRDNPFALQIAIFGGGGFFGLAIGTDGVELLEVSLDFGAMCSIDLGVASGSVHLLAGIYFSYGLNDKGVNTCVLSGFVKLGGSLSILGIVSISLEFDMSLTYQTPPSEVTGTATLTVSISVLFFSFSASVTASKTFGGGNTGTSVAGAATVFLGALPPPTFEDQVPPDSPGGTTSTLWTTYCAAFATN